MSNVFRRNRKPTGQEFYDTMVTLTDKLTHFVMNDKNVPKSYRYVYAIPIIGLLHRLRTAITNANTTYPVNERLLEKRKDYWLDAICANEDIFQAIQALLDVLPIDLDKLDEIGELLRKESALLRGLRKNAKILGER